MISKILLNKNNRNNNNKMVATVSPGDTKIQWFSWNKSLGFTTCERHSILSNKPLLHPLFTLWLGFFTFIAWNTFWTFSAVTPSTAGTTWSRHIVLLLLVTPESEEWWPHSRHPVFCWMNAAGPNKIREIECLESQTKVRPSDLEKHTE